MGITAITHPTSPYTADHIERMSNVGITPDFQVSSRGADTDRRAALRFADQCIRKLESQPRDLSWLNDEKE